MKRLLAAAALLSALSTAALSEDTLVKLDDPSAPVTGALWKSMNVRFSDAFAKGRLASPDVDKLLVSELPEGKICFQDGADDAIDLEAPAMKDVARANKGDFCVARSEVSARYTPVPSPAGAPPSPFYSIDNNACRWNWEQGADIGVWYEECTYDGLKSTAAFDDKTGELLVTTTGSDEKPYSDLREFHNPGGLEALAKELKAQGLVANTDECQVQPVKDTIVPLPPGWTAMEIGPVGRLKEAFDKASDGEIPEPPCGEYGTAVDYIGFFMVHKDHPDRPVFVDLGQDVSALDLPSITLK